MKRIYRMVFNEARNAWMAVPEFAKAKGKRVGGPSALAVAMGIFFGGMGVPEEARAEYYFNDGRDNGCYRIMDGGTTGQVTNDPNCATGPSNPGADIVFYDNKSMSVGGDLSVYGDTQLKYWKQNAGTGVASVATGAGAMAMGDGAVAGDASVSGGVPAQIAIGRLATAFNSGAVAMGAQANAGGQDSFAAAYNASVAKTANGGVALGASSRVTVSNGVALGASSVADRGALTSVVDPLSYSNGRVNTTLGEISVGSSTAQRQITNLAAGTQNTDAANVGQVNAVKSVVDTNATRIAAALGGGSTVGADGTVSAPSYTVGGTTFNNVGGALGNLDTRVTSNATALSTLDGAAVKYGDVNKGTITLGGAGGTTLTGLKDGALSASSTDAVTGRQLKATNDNVTQNATDIATANTNITALDTRVTKTEGDIGTLNSNVAKNTADITTANTNISALDTRVTKSEGDISTTNTNVAAIDTRVTKTEGDITTINTNVTKNAADIATANTSITALDTRLTKNEGDVTNLTTQLSSGSVGLVQQDAESKNLTVAKDLDGTQISFAGKDADGNAINRKLTGLADGDLSDASTDAVTGKQLKSTNDSVTAIDTRVTKNEGDITTLNTNVAKNTADIAQANTNITALDTRVSKTETSINSLTNQLDSGAVGLVQQDADSKTITVAKDLDGTEVSFGGKKDADGNVTKRKLTDLADGEESDTSSDAVTGKQLHATTTRVATLETTAVQYDDATKGSITLNKGGNAVQLKNVADGADDSDAVNMRQLKSSGLVNADGTVSSAVTYTDATRTTVSMGGVGGALITNVRAGNIAAGSTDAVNGSQIAALRDNLESSIKGVSDRVTTIEQNGGGTGGGGTGGGGSASQGSGESSTTGGADAEASGKKASSFGSKAKATGSNSTSMGANATASADNSTAIGADSVADRANTVSVGSAGSERAIANVADGTKPYDAVNFKQLSAVNTRVDQVQADLNNLRDDVYQRMSDQERKMDKLGAMNAAMSSMTASAAGLRTDNRVAIGAGYMNGQSAVALGYQRRINDTTTLTVGGSTSGTEYNLGVGVGMGW